MTQFRILRARSLILFVAPALAGLMMFLIDPDNGANTQVWLINLLKFVFVVSFAHATLKSLLDYAAADREELFKMAKITSHGSGLALLAEAITFAALLMTISGMAHGEPVPPQAAPYLRTLGGVTDAAWPDHPARYATAALIEHESGCFSMPKKCWNPRSRLKTAREEGAGLGQLTRAYRADGSLRFDALAELRERYPSQLRELTWATVYERPDLQLTAVLLKTREDYKYFTPTIKDAQERLYFSYTAYNGGRADVLRSRQVCFRVPACDPQKWVGHVQNHCVKSTVALYGPGTSPCDISTAYAVDILVHRAPRYRGLV